MLLALCWTRSFQLKASEMILYISRTHKVVGISYVSVEHLICPEVWLTSRTEPVVHAGNIVTSAP